MITGLKQNILLTNKNNSAKHSSRERKVAIFFVGAKAVLFFLTRSLIGYIFWFWEVNQSESTVFCGKSSQEIIWRQLQEIWRPPLVCGKNRAKFSFSSGSFVNFWAMDEKIIRLCEENNVPSLVQALSTFKNQKVCVIYHF